MNRPKVICHILSSLDGRIDGDFFMLPETMELSRKYGQIRKDYNPDAILNGATTCAEIFADGYIDLLPSSEIHYERSDFIAARAKKYAVCIDTNGALKWNSNTATRGGVSYHVIQVLTESVSDNYIAHLRENNISYIFAGKAALDIPLALKKLKDLFSINTVMLSGGGAINWSFLQAGCIDELSLLIAPSTDGLRDTATTFDRSVFLSGGVPVGFTLKEAKRVRSDGVWLTYIPNNIKR